MMFSAFWEHIKLSVLVLYRTVHVHVGSIAAIAAIAAIDVLSSTVDYLLA
jgi:hypothetical protein